MLLDLTGKKILVTGIANNRSIAWGIAQQLKAAGAELGITYLPDEAEALMDAGQSKEESRFWVFRRGGLPCRVCGTTVKKISGSGQPCFLCPECQKC